MGIDLSGGHEAMDYDEHEKTYALFVKVTVYLVAMVLLLLIFMALFLA